MSPTCFCTGQCRQIGYCPTAGGPPMSVAPLTVGPQTPLVAGRTYREPLTTDEVRQIVREELERRERLENA